MIFTRPMIDLAKEVRRRAPTELKPSIKMANPEMFDLLIELYKNSKDAVFRALVKELVSMAGEPWKSTLIEQDAPKQNTQKQLVRPSMDALQGEWFDRHDDNRRKRIYRGHVVSG